MVYESGFTSRRTYTSRPIVTSYAVSYPTVTNVSRVYKTSYPIYSTKSYTRGTRVISSPVRIVTSPARVIHSPSPVRVTSMTTTRVVTSPERFSSYIFTTPTTYTSSYIPSSCYSSYTPHISSYIPRYTSSYIPRYTSSYIPSNYMYSSPSYLYSSPVTRIYSRSLTPVRVISSPVRVTSSYLKRTLPGYGSRALTNYLSTEPFTTFREETGRIRNRAQSLMRDLHTPVIRRARSMTPFPVTGYEPSTDVAFDAYVSRITNPVRHIAKEVHRMSMYPEPAHKYVGKSHLASVRICGDKAYNIRRPLYDTDKIRTDINLLSWYLRHPTVKKQKHIEEKVESVDTDPELDPHRPSRKFSAPRPLEDPIDDETKEKQRLRHDRLMTVNENELDHIEVKKKKAQSADEAKHREQTALDEEVKRKVKEATTFKAPRHAEEAARLAEEDRKRQEEELKHLAALKAEEAKKRANEEDQRHKAAKEEETRLEEEAKLAEETRLAAAARLAEEARLVEEARLAKESKLAEEAAIKAAEVARLAEEQRLREEEITKLAEIEKQAKDEHEAELARQAAELVEIARHEAEIAAQELQNIEQTEQAETIANSVNEPIIEEPVSPEVQQQEEPTIDLNITSSDADVADASTEEETEEE